MMVTSNVSSSPHLDIPKGSPPFSIDQQMVNFISIPAIRGTPCDFMDLSVWKKGAPYHQIISCAKLNKPFSIFIDDATPVSSHHSVTA